MVEVAEWAEPSNPLVAAKLNHSTLNALRFVIFFFWFTKAYVGGFIEEIVEFIVVL